MPPSATVMSVIPVTLPPVIDIVLEFCVAIVPRPRFVLASAAVEAPVPPSATVMSVMPVTLPPVIDTALEFCVAIVPRPRFVLASAAVEAPVPPSIMAKSEVRDRVGKWSICTAMFVPSDQIVRVLPAGTATPVPAAVVLPSTVEL